MKINENFILRQITDTFVVLPIGQATVSFNGMIKLNESGAFLWRQLEQGATRDTLADALSMEYDIPKKEAQADVDGFLASLVPVGCIEE